MRDLLSRLLEGIGVTTSPPSGRPLGAAQVAAVVAPSPGMPRRNPAKPDASPHATGAAWVDCTDVGLLDRKGASVPGALVVVPTHAIRAAVLRTVALSAAPVIVERASRDGLVAGAVARLRGEGIEVIELVWHAAQCGRRLLVLEAPASDYAPGCGASALVHRAISDRSMADDHDDETALGLGPATSGPRRVRRAPRPDEAGIGALTEVAEASGVEWRTDPSVSLPVAPDASSLHLSSLDWDLPEDLDLPSGFDGVMHNRQRAGAAKPADDSLPSTSSIFGEGYREHGVAAAGRGAAGRTDEVAAVSTAGEVSAAADADVSQGDSLSDLSLSPEISELGLSLDAPLEERTVLLELDFEPEPAPRDEHTAPTTAVASAPTGPSAAVAAVAATDDASAPDPESVRPIELPETEPRTELSSQKLHTIDAVPRIHVRTSQETPLVPPRHLQKTPIITSPVVAARSPTPPQQPAAAGSNWKLAVVFLAGVVLTLMAVGVFLLLSR